MNMAWSRLGIRARITAGLTIILVLAMASAGYTVYRNQFIKSLSSDVASSWIPVLENLSTVNTLIVQHYLLVSDRLNGHNQLDAAAFTRNLKDRKESLLQATQVYETLQQAYTQGDPQVDAEIALFVDYRVKRDAYLNAAKVALDALDAAQGDEGRLVHIRKDFANTVPPAFLQTYQAMQKTLKFDLDGTATAVLGMKDTVTTAELATLGALLVIVALGLLLIWLIPASVIHPVRQAMELASRIAEGDLSSRQLSKGHDELGRLLASLEQMQAQLAHLVSNVRKGSESVSTSSAEIAHGNNDLSARTEQQASALEEAAASMEELRQAWQCKAEK